MTPSSDNDLTDQYGASASASTSSTPTPAPQPVSIPRTSGRRDKLERPSLPREVGSATISLRPRAVSRLSDEDDDDSLSPATLKQHSAGPSRLSYAPIKPASSPPRPPPSFAQQWSPRRPRQRAKSVSYNADQADSKRNFYLSHYSTDTQYSREQVGTDSDEIEGLPRKVIELGLGDDFDASFGEALKRGMGGEEINLGKEALRVLSESYNAGKMGKQGRKGSIGMGLFRESRAAAAAGEAPFQVAPGMMSRTTSEKKKRREEAVVVEELEEELQHEQVQTSRTRSATVSTIKNLGAAVAASAAAAGVASYPTGVPSNGGTQPDPPRSPRLNRSRRATHVPPVAANDEAAIPAGSRPTEPPVLGEELQTEEDSGWTTGTGSSSDSSGSEEEEESLDERSRYREKRSASLELGEDDEADEVGLETTDVDSEDEGMTVPLQPFNHAVGGHSSIYKFTRRAVCKVSRECDSIVKVQENDKR